MQKSSENLLSSYVDALHPLIYINHFDFTVVDNALRNIASDSYVTEYNNALGEIDFATKSPLHECSLCGFLKTHREDGYDQSTFIVLRDIHGELDKPEVEVIALLKRIAEDNLYREDYHATVFIVSPKVVIPLELENYITVFDIPLPEYDEIEGIIKEFASGLAIQIEQDVINDIARSFRGLNEFQIRQILNLAYQNGGTVNSEKKQLIINEKKQFIKKSGMLELVNFSETIDDIGGLENLKDWLIRKSKVFADLDKAIRFGVSVPKGIMIVGMPGCGKSLTAKATARLFNIPLVRLDVGRLLGKYVGESEDNMRRALSVAEAISPCVLWIDEIEKAFSGVGSSGSDVTTRLFGQFLTWMQEKDNSVFIVATANDISGLPPEFLRKGRFDEIFFVDLPNAEERRKIIEIHLKKRSKWNRDIDSIALIKSTKGFNGADIESVVKNAIELAFIKRRDIITTDDLLDIIRDTKSISVTLKDKIAKITESVANLDIQLASRDESEEPKSASDSKESKGLHVTKRPLGKIQEAYKRAKRGIFTITHLKDEDYSVNIPKGTDLSEWTVVAPAQPGILYEIIYYGDGCYGRLKVKNPALVNEFYIENAHRYHTNFHGLAVKYVLYDGIVQDGLYLEYRCVKM